MNQDALTTPPVTNLSHCRCADAGCKRGPGHSTSDYTSYEEIKFSRSPDLLSDAFAAVDGSHSGDRGLHVVILGACILTSLTGPHESDALIAACGHRGRLQHDEAAWRSASRAQRRMKANPFKLSDDRS